MRQKRAHIAEVKAIRLVVEQFSRGRHRAESHEIVWVTPDWDGRHSLRIEPWIACSHIGILRVGDRGDEIGRAKGTRLEQDSHPMRQARLGHHRLLGSPRRHPRILKIEHDRHAEASLDLGREQHRIIGRAGDQHGADATCRQQVHQRLAQEGPRPQADIAYSEGASETRRQGARLQNLDLLWHQRGERRIEEFLMMDRIDAEHDRRPTSLRQVLGQMPGAVHSREGTWREVGGDNDNSAGLHGGDSMKRGVLRFLHRP